MVNLIWGEKKKSHPNIHYPLILKIPPGIYYLGGGRGTVW